MSLSWSYYEWRFYWVPQSGMASVDYCICRTYVQICLILKSSLKNQVLVYWFSLCILSGYTFPLTSLNILSFSIHLVFWLLQVLGEFLFLVQFIWSSLIFCILIYIFFRLVEFSSVIKKNILFFDLGFSFLY